MEDWTYNADLIIGSLSASFTPASLLQVTCGPGHIIDSARRRWGTISCMGVEDAGYADIPRLFAQSDFRRANITDPAVLSGRKFDLVCCLETAQKIPAQSAENFVRSLTGLGDTIVFSAAIPGQSGSAARNAQYLSYWRDLFSQFQFHFHDFFRPRHWADQKVFPWLKQNVVLFYREGTTYDRILDQENKATNVLSDFGNVIHHSYYRDALARHSQRQKDLESARRCYAVPYKRIFMLDEYLLSGDQKTARNLCNRIIEDAHLTTVTNRIDLVQHCINNDLLSAARLILNEHVSSPSPSAEIEKLAMKLADATGNFEDLWRLMERTGAARRQEPDAVFLALALRKQDYISTVSPEHSSSPHLAPVLGLAATDAPPQGIRPSVFVVNVPSDRYRRIRLERAAALLGIQPHFRRGYKPGEIPEQGRKLFRRHIDESTDGTFGNQYSQYLVWKEIANGDGRPGLIVEDDSILVADPGTVLAAASPPPRWDIIFANDRLSLKGMSGVAQDAFSVTNFREAFKWHSHSNTGRAGFGTDCYFLSQSGARKLVEIAESEKFNLKGTDWWIQSHCVPPSFLDEVNKESRIHYELERHFTQDFHDHTLLDAWVLNPSLNRMTAIGTSRRQRI